MLTSTPRNRSTAHTPSEATTGRIGRTITPRRGLPSSRSVVGGLLVAVAAVGTWAAVTGAGDDPAPRYVVAGRAVGPGQQIEPADLAWATVDLPSDQRAQAFTSVDQLLGAIAVGPIASGELVQVGSVASDRTDPGQGELSFTVDAEWAVGGRLRAGDTIDVFATDDGVDGRSSTKVLAGATIRRIDTASGDGFGRSNQQVVTVGVGEEAAALITAARNGDLTVVRTNGAASGSSSNPRPSTVEPSTATDDDTSRSNGSTTTGGGG